MEKTDQPNKGNLIRTLIVYLGGAWVFIEAINFLIDKYNWNTTILDILILLVIFGLPAILIYTWFQQKFTRKAIILQSINGIIAIAVIVFTLSSPGSLNPTQLRLLKFKDNQKQLAESIQSLLVLPFDNYTGNDDFEYYVSGMHDAIIGDLGQMGALTVISKTTSRIFKNVEMSIPNIATEVGVDAVVEGSVTCVEGDKVCIQIRLVSAFPKEQQLWVQDFYTEKSNILNLYNQVSKKITEEINIVLTPQEENILAETKTVNPDAYDAYLKGKYYWDQLTLDGLQKSLEYFNLSLEKDNEFAPAYSGIATTYIGLMQMGFTSPSICIPKIYENTQKALELDPNYSDSHLTSAVMGVWTEWNWEKGESEFLKALELNPNDVMAHAYYAHLLMILLRSEEAYDHINIAMELDPLNPLIQSLYGVVLYYKGEYQLSIVEANKAISVVPNHTLAWRVLGLSFHELRDFKNAFNAWLIVLPIDDETKLSLGKTFEEKGYLVALEETALHLEKVSQTSFVQPFMVGVSYSCQNNSNKAMEWFEKAYETHDPDMPYIQCQPLFNQFIGEPAFDALVEKMKFK